jgi:hypothetical protein
MGSPTNAMFLPETLSLLKCQFMEVILQKAIEKNIQIRVRCTRYWKCGTELFHYWTEEKEKESCDEKRNWGAINNNNSSEYPIFR